MDNKRFEELVETNIPFPKEKMTIGIIKTNGRISILEKSDGSYCLKNENTREENGAFLTKEEALGFWNDIISDSNG